MFSGNESLADIISFLRDTTRSAEKKVYANTLPERVAQCYPYPLIRHHYGRPTLEETIAGAKKLAEACVLDILSIAPDQNAQEFFFEPEKMRKGMDGAGGVPIRKKEDLETIYRVTRCGNYPLLRCYSGTTNLQRWAEMLKETINNCRGAIPLTWYSELDGRSTRSLKEAIK